MKMLEGKGEVEEIHTQRKGRMRRRRWCYFPKKQQIFYPIFCPRKFYWKSNLLQTWFFCCCLFCPGGKKKRERGKIRRMVEEKLAHLTKKAFHSFRAIIEALFLPNITLFVSSINMTAPLAYCCCCCLWKPIVITHLKTKFFPHSSIIQC